MTWLDDAVQCLQAIPVCGYRRKAQPAVEPTSLAALALLAAERGDQAASALDWLSDRQAANGSLGINADTPRPCWPTGWALLAWNNGVKTLAPANPRWSDAAHRATDWMLSVSGQPVHTSSDMEGQRRIFGHDTTLQGWPWVEGTHSWVEPTAINLLALRSAGKAAHPRCREAVRLLLDRQLPDGGWNFGNTTVLDHVLRPNTQSTGVALAALADQPDIERKAQRSIDWLARNVSARTTPASLGYALIALGRFGHWPSKADQWLRSAGEHVLVPDGSPCCAALLILAAKRGLR
ncbi:MAG: hypothetical protein LLG00_07260 [Planctomycetaceae bacterium]|nr:hypothetical protein [Planctomycetaceae bacterium]